MQTRKLQFIEEYLRLINEEIIEKLEKLLVKERRKSLTNKLTPMSIEEFYLRNKTSQGELKSGKLIAQNEVEKYFDDKK